ncbi:4-carboxymuconolactone decarboxylase [Roseococcus sp. SYP-B2431]|uniref:carboxymuconolactone decarboxylase family protein n=1 Tax=Roseococcus sp. SYP-B2431 TaxID=2496640 RepID=UPI00103E74E5|nr:carboxymuconolactone decarboxylase family protein [Roseococcus sp. SYP-B2431]TCH98211.1 4-carboxymuconolactone decarboxylase [Roseococcus sp. SYP-B2431]
MNENAAHEALRARGRAEMREILGSAYTEARDKGTNPFNAAVRALSEEMAYATLWTRPGLDRKQRSLITLAMICALNHPHELRIHLVAALNNGCTAEEISEVFTHAVAYCGFPAAIDALRLAEQVLKEQGAI